MQESKWLPAMDYPANTADMTSIVVKLKSLNPEVVIPMSYLNECIALYPHSRGNETEQRDSGWRRRILGSLRL